MTDAGIDRLYAAWRDAYTRKDVDAVLGLLTPDYVLIAPGAPELSVAQLRPLLEAAFAKYDVASEFEREEQIVSGDLAFERGWDVQTIRVPGNDEPVKRRQRVFLILRRGSDGVWRFARGMSQPPS